MKFIAVFQKQVYETQGTKVFIQCLSKIPVKFLSLFWFLSIPEFFSLTSDFWIPDGQRRHGYPRGRHHRGRDQHSTTRRRRCGNPTSHSLRSLLQNAHFLPLLRRNALRYVQAGPEMRGLRPQFPQKMRFQDPQRLLEPEEKAATFLQPQLL